jgi:putative ABC transport system permease protein
VNALSAVILLLRRFRAEIGILALLFVLVTSTSFLFAAAPRLFNRVSDDAMRYAAGNALAVDRDVWLYADGSIGPGSDGGVAAVQEYGQQREAEFPSSIESLISDRFQGITTVRFTVPQSIVTMSLRYQDGLTDDATLTEGRWPVDRGMPLQMIPVGKQADQGDQAPPTVFEVALSTTEADAIDAHVGDHLNLALDGSDPLVPRTVFVITPTQAEVVGLFEPKDPTGAEWSGSGLLQPTLLQGPDGPSGIRATAYVPAESYARLAASALPFHYDWHFQVDAQRLDADQVATLQTDLQRLNLVVAPTDTRFIQDLSASVNVSNVSIGTGLLQIVDKFAAQRARSESVLSIAAIGLLGLAAGATAMVAILLVRQRRSSLLLARGRGASGRFVLGAQVLESVLLAGSAALVGFVLAVVAVPARDSSLSPVLALVVAISAAVMLVAATWPAARRPLIQLERDDPPVLRVPARRLVIELTIVGIAIVAIFLLRQRGLTLGTNGDTAAFDPLLAAVPLLAGVAAGIVLMRLYPLPVRGLSRFAARRRDFVPVVGLRTVARHPAAANLPLLVLMLTAAFGAFASVVESSVDRGQLAASYIKVGADYRLEHVGIGGLPTNLDPSTVPGVRAVADGYVDTSAQLSTGLSRHGSVDFTAVDAAAYQAVTAATAAAPEWPSSFYASPSAVGIGSPQNPIPAIISSQTPSGLNIGIGDTFTVAVSRQTLTFRLVGKQDDFPGHGSATTFVLVPLNWFRAAIPDTTFVPSIMWLRASNEAAQPLAGLVGAADRQVRIVSRQDAYANLHDAPFGSAVANFFGISLIVAVLFMGVTLVGAVILSAASRSRDLAYLRTLGVSSRQARELTAVEHAPPVLLALIPGVLLGIGVALLVEPGLGLADFVGEQGVPLTVNWASLGIIVVVLLAVVVVAIGAGTWLAGRVRLASALRIEES